MFEGGSAGVECRSRAVMQGRECVLGYYAVLHDKIGNGITFDVIDATHRLLVA